MSYSKLLLLGGSVALLLASGCAVDGTETVSAEESEGASAEEATAAKHIPKCTKIGSTKEGWRWADTGALIKYAKCESLTPTCRAIGSRSEGWYAEGLVTWAQCAEVARIHRNGDTCGPSVGYTCDASAGYCAGIPSGTKGGSGICRPFGTCALAADCNLDANTWSHAEGAGSATCDSNQCNWISDECQSTADCQEGKSCIGIPHDGTSAYGICHSTAQLPGESLICSSTAVCAEGLDCAGLSMGPEGDCRPSWMFGQYFSADQGIKSSVVVHGLASVPVDIVVKAKFGSQSINNATVTLTDPNGAVATLCKPSARCKKQAFLDGLVVAGNSRDDQVNGLWTLKIAGSNAVIKSFTLNLSSRWD